MRIEVEIAKNCGSRITFTAAQRQRDMWVLAPTTTFDQILHRPSFFFSLALPLDLARPPSLLPSR